MTFLNSALLWGLMLAAIPVALHLLMRQKPRKLVFPALRLLQQVQRQSVRRLRMRHVALMLLRILAIALIVFALARPSLPPANYSLTPWEWGIFLALVAGGVTTFLVAKGRLKKRPVSSHQLQEQTSALRNRITLATLAAVLLFVGWPYQRRVAGEIEGPPATADLNLPVAGVMLFDNSLSMSYLQAGEDSLDRAKAIAKAHLQTLPTGSRIAVGDTGSDRPMPFQSTMNSAVSRIDSLSPVSTAIPLEDRLREALKSQTDDRRRIIEDLSGQAEQDQRDRYIRRIYLFTDLAKSAWRPSGSSLLLADLEKYKNVNLYVIDVGQTQGENRAITSIDLSSQRIPLGGELMVSVSAQSQGKDFPQQGIELFLEGQGGELLKQGQVEAKLDANLPASIPFPLLSGVTQPWLHGEARLIGTDPLAFDNTRYFTVEVSSPPEILVVAPEEKVAQAWMTALAPYERGGASLNKFKPVFARVDQLRNLSLSKYPNITLINCPQLSDEVWLQLGKYVEDGGGLIVILGSSRISAASYNRASAQSFLPATLDSWHPLGEWSITIPSRNHPLFSVYRRLESYGAFSMFESLVYVTRFWKVTPAQGATVLASYTDTEQWPAFIERSHGKGRTLMLTTDASLPDNPNDRWNNLPSPLLDAWLFLAFVEQATEYVSRFGNVDHMFLSGQTPMVRVEPRPVDRSFLLRMPDLRQTRHFLPANESLLLFKDVDSPGHYDVSDAETREIVGAFSINPQPAESDLTRMTLSDLDDRLGKGRYQMADSLERLKDHINTADLGQEIYPVLLVLVIVLFCGELLVANRFYDSPSGTPPSAPSSSQ